MADLPRELLEGPPVSPVAARQVAIERDRETARAMAADTERMQKLVCTPKSEFRGSKEPTDSEIARAYEAQGLYIDGATLARDKGYNPADKMPVRVSVRNSTSRGYATGGIVDPATRAAAPPGPQVNIVEVLKDYRTKTYVVRVNASCGVCGCTAECRTHWCFEEPHNGFIPTRYKCYHCGEVFGLDVRLP